MSDKLIHLPKNDQKDEESKEEANQSFEAIIAANKAKADKQKRERDLANAKVLREYKIK